MIIALGLRQLSAGLALPFDSSNLDSQLAFSSNNRTIYDIVWSCLTVIFACTWMAVHPNIHQGSSLSLETGIGKRHSRLLLFFFALGAPELMVLSSFRQWLLARKLARKYQEFGWTMVHGFFAIMNGFQTRKPGSERYSTIHLDDLEIYLRNGDITITKDEIQDRSKGDWFSKSIIILQVTWFILQILVRVVRHLAITELEIATCAFAILNFMTYFFWWNKPFDVDCPIILPAYDESGTKDTSSPSFQDRLTPEVRSSSKQTPEGNLIVGRDLPPSHLQFESTPSNSQSSKECDDNIESNGHDDVTHLNASQSLESSESFEDQASDSAKDNGYTSNGPAITMSPPLSIPNQVILHGPDTHPHDVSYTDLRGDMHGQGVFCERPLLESFNPLWDEFNLQSYHEKLRVHVLSCGAAVVFGVTHCLAWHFEFPNKTEQLLWRVSSIATSCVPIFILVFGESGLWLRVQLSNPPRPLTSLVNGVCVVVDFSSRCVYILARLFLLVDMFVVLRKPNPGIFTSVDWVNNIPHI